MNTMSKENDQREKKEEGKKVYKIKQGFEIRSNWGEIANGVCPLLLGSPPVFIYYYRQKHYCIWTSCPSPLESGNWMVVLSKLWNNNNSYIFLWQELTTWQAMGWAACIVFSPLSFTTAFRDWCYYPYLTDYRQKIREIKLFAQAYELESSHGGSWAHD